MKIEKKSNTSFCCVLTAKELEDRQIRLDELAYGSTKARKLFEDVVWEAEESCGVYLAGEPLVVEAIPLKSQGLLLEFSVLEDSDELDCRYSEFTLAGGSRDTEEDDLGADDLLEESVSDFLMRKLTRKLPGGEDILRDRRADTEGRDEELPAEEKDILAETAGAAEEETAAARKAAADEMSGEQPAESAGAARSEEADGGVAEKETAAADEMSGEKPAESDGAARSEETDGGAAEETAGAGEEAAADGEMPGADDAAELPAFAETELLDPDEEDEEDEEENDAASMANAFREQIEESLRKIFPDAMVESVDMTTVRVTGSDDMDEINKGLLKIFADKIRDRAARESGSDDEGLGEILSDRGPDTQKKPDRRGRAPHSRQNRASFRLFLFESLENALAGAVNVTFFRGESVLFHGREGYSLALLQGDSDPRDFNRVCNVLSEYGIGRAATPASVAYLAEHDQIIFRGDAIRKLAAIEGISAESGKDA